jgi:hypothetical protein
MEWKSIEYLDNLYEASSCGRIRSKARLVVRPHSRTGKPVTFYYAAKELSQHTDVFGYFKVRFGFGGNKYCYQVGRLVLMAFNGNPTDEQFCRHLNGNPKDNRIENLAWGTHTENMQDRKAHGNYPIGEDHPRSKITNKQAIEIYNSNEGSSYLSKKYGLHESKIWAIRSGKTWTEVTGAKKK